MAAEMTGSTLTDALYSVSDDVEGRMNFVQTFLRSRGWVLTDMVWDGRSQPARGMRLAFVSDGGNQQQPMLAVFTDRKHASDYVASVPAGANPFTNVAEVEVAWAMLGVPVQAGVMINPNTPRCFRISPQAAAELTEGVKRSLAARAERQSLKAAETPSQPQAPGEFDGLLLKIQNAVEVHDIATAEQGTRELEAAGAPEAYVLCSQGLVAKCKRDYPTAVALVERAIPLTLHKQMEGEFWWFLAQILQESLRYPEAERAYNKAIECEPGRFGYSLDLARLYSTEMRETDKALALLHEVVRRFPDEPGPAIFVSNVLAEAGRHEEAVTEIDKVIARHPTVAGAHFNRATYLQMLGRIDEAKVTYERALTLDPALDGHQQYVNLRKSDSGAAASEIYLKLLERRAQEDFPMSSRIDSEFALAKLYESSGDMDRSFEHLQKANALKRSTIAWNADDASREFDKMIRLFTPEFIARYRGRVATDAAPIFVLGMPRSGTTLTEQILAGHSKVNAGGELTHLSSAADTFLKKWAEADVNGADQEAELMADMREVGAAFIRHTESLQISGKRITDKMPGNFLHIGFIYLLFPSASVVHCHRNPIDNCLSCYERLFSRGVGFSYSMQDVATYYHLYRKVMAHWRKVLPKDFIHDVEYEQMVDDNENQVRRLLAFCGLDFEEACLNFHEVKRAVTTASSLQVRKPLYKTSVARWKKYGDRLKPLIDALGPELTGPDV